MKNSLQLKTSQNLTMTPQLQQAIRLLQLSSMELKQEIQEFLETNMMLELDEEQDNVTQAVSEEQTDTRADTTVNEEPSRIPEDLPVDSVWEDIYDSSVSLQKGNGESFSYDFLNTSTNTLGDHLLWQLNLTPLSENDNAIAVTIIDSLDDDGYLTCSLEDILDTLNDEHNLELDEIEAVLRIIQNMEPAGVAARDLKECLLIQLRQCPEDTPWLNEARLLVGNYLDLLAVRNYKQLQRQLKLDQSGLQEVITLIQSMDPRPGSRIQQTQTEYIVPDVYVKKEKGVWRVELNTESMPQLRINSNYARMIRRADYSDDNTSLKNHLQEARWFIKSLQSRSETLLKVASAIVERQRAFLDYGEEAMKPLVLHDIADSLGLHESTISRVTTHKYMHTPRGIYELKYFFSSQLDTDFGGACSSTAIRAILKKLIEAESPTKPLSDSKLSATLAEQGFKVARRTIAKYREAMGIPPSNERKRLF